MSTRWRMRRPIYRSIQQERLTRPERRVLELGERRRLPRASGRLERREERLVALETALATRRELPSALQREGRRLASLERLHRGHHGSLAHGWSGSLLHSFMSNESAFLAIPAIYSQCDTVKLVLSPNGNDEHPRSRDQSHCRPTCAAPRSSASAAAPAPAPAPSAARGRSPAVSVLAHMSAGRARATGAVRTPSARSSAPSARTSRRSRFGRSRLASHVAWC